MQGNASEFDKFFDDSRALTPEVVEPDLKTLSQEEALALLQKERERNARLKEMLHVEQIKKPPVHVQLVLKVSEKGAVSVYGLQRFPITLYPEAWLKVLAIADQIKQFIEANKSKLSWKNS